MEKGKLAKKIAAIATRYGGQDKLAQKLRTVQSAVSHYVTGSREPDALSCLLLAALSDTEEDQEAFLSAIPRLNREWIASLKQMIQASSKIAHVEPPEIVLQKIHSPEREIPEVDDTDQWLDRLGFILRFGDGQTRDAITRNLERFHLLTRMLAEKPLGADPKLSREVPTDQQIGMEHLRELGARSARSETDRRTDAEELPGAADTDSGKTGTGGKH